ncbi:hypothetical protein TNCV_1107621 [Trichonephila clavipes]|nr:hypothetical protein TNCV_1107621 [Trichonephila clavipes]
MVGCFQSMYMVRIIGSKILGSQHVAHICGDGYSSGARLQLLLEFTQHMLFKFLCPRTPGTPCVDAPAH